MAEPDTAADYGDRDVKAAYSVLIELGQVLGAYREKFVVIGGAVPWLLLKGAEPAHVGTLDIDLNLDPAALGDGEYATFVETLEKAGYERGVEGLKKFQLRRMVKVDEGDPIAVIVDLLMPREAKPAKNAPPLVDGLAVQKADGAAIALECNVTLVLEGRMPDGRNNTVEILVATIPASLVMKGYALTGRDKNKDAYDIYYEVRNFPGGPEKLAEECRALWENKIAREGLSRLASKFKAVDDFGPQTVRAFLVESDALGGMTADQVQEDAFRQARAFLVALGLAK